MDMICNMLLDINYHGYVCNMKLIDHLNVAYSLKQWFSKCFFPHFWSFPLMSGNKSWRATLLEIFDD